MQKETTPELPVNEKCANAILALLPTMQGEKHAPDIKRLCEIYFLEAGAKNKLESLSGIEDFMKRAVSEVAFIWHYIGIKFSGATPFIAHPMSVYVRAEIAQLPLSNSGAKLAEIVTQFFEQKNDAEKLTEATAVDSRPSDTAYEGNS